MARLPPIRVCLRLLATLAAAGGLVGCGSPGGGFSLLPKSLQKAPATHLTVITEMTPEGRTAPPPTAEAPAYYTLRSIDYHNEGMEFGHNRPMPLPDVQRLLESALAQSHYLPASPEHPAALVLIVLCGSANTIDDRINPGFATGNGTGNALPSLAFPNGNSSAPSADTGTDVPQPPPDVMGTRDYAARQNFLVRARLVGGDKFARGVENALKQQDQFLSTGGGVASAQPLDLFENANPKNRLLVEETMVDRYFVVVSAYAAVHPVPGAPQLLWRTKLTTSSEGVTMDETLPDLVGRGGPYLGRDMTEAEILPEVLQREPTGQ